MKITEEVILDLLVLYFDGEASDDTQALVVSYFEEHPDFAKNMKKMYHTMKKSSEKGMFANIPVEYKPDEEMRILKRTQRLLRLRTNLLIIGIVGIIFPFILFTFFDIPHLNSLGALFLLAGIVSWVGYFIIRYRLRISGV